MCLQKDKHTNVCAHTHWMQSGGCSRLWHTQTHTHTRTHAVGGHPSFHTTARRRGAATDMASLCGVVWATGRHAWRGGHGQLHSCSAWIPPVPSQEKRENEGGRGSQRVSRCDLCWHCMSMLMKKEKEGEGDTHLSCSCCCPFGCLPASHCAVPCCCATHTLPSSSHPHHHCVAPCTRCMCMHV